MVSLALWTQWPPDLRVPFPLWTHSSDPLSHFPDHRAESPLLHGHCGRPPWGPVLSSGLKRLPWRTKLLPGTASSSGQVQMSTQRDSDEKLSHRLETAPFLKSLPVQSHSHCLSPGHVLEHMRLCPPRTCWS